MCANYAAEIRIDPAAAFYPFDGKFIRGARERERERKRKRERERERYGDCSFY